MLYQDVAQRLSQAIHSGALRSGDRLPSVRKLSTQEKVSVSTVLAAYVELESLGLVETRPQSGHYVRSRAALTAKEPLPSRPTGKTAAVSVCSDVAMVYRGMRDPRVVPLGTASIDPGLLPIQRLTRELLAAARSHPDLSVSYDMPPGLPALRQQLARRAVDWGCALSPEDFLTTCGASEAMHLCLRAVAKPGEVVAIESPTYYGVLREIESLGLRALEIPTCPREGMDLEALEAALKRERIAAVVAVPNFNNPLGSRMPDAHKERLAQLVSRHEVPLIEDDIYGDLHFGPDRPKVVKSFDKKGLVLLCGSVSKTLAPGYRVGWVAAGRYAERVEQLKFSQTVATPTLTQMAVASFLKSGGYDRHLRILRRKLQEQVTRTQDAVSEHFPEGTGITRPAGGSVLWVELPRQVSGITLHERAQEAGIAVAPGPIFSPRKGRYDHFIRLACGQRFTPRIEQALATVGRLACSLAVSRPLARDSK